MENPILALIPSGYKNGKVYSILPVDGDGDFDFFRFGDATRVKENGLIETITGSNNPRLNWSGDCPSLLMEGTSTNLLTYSQELSQWTKQNLTITDDDEISPEGTLNASKVLETAVNNFHFAYNGVISASTSTDYNFSIFVKKLGRQYVGIQTLFNTVKGAIALFDLDNGLVAYTFQQGGHTVSDAKIENYGNDWFRISANFQVNDGTLVCGLVTADELWTSGTAYNNAFLGDISKGVYAFGGQVEQSSYTSSYIKTEGSQTTRALERRVKAQTDFNENKGVVFLDVKPFAVASSDTIGNVINLRGGIYNLIQFGFKPSNVLQFYINHNPGPPLVNYNFTHNGERLKVAVKWDSGDYKIFANGQLLNSYLSSGRFFSLLDVFQFQGNDDYANFEGEIYNSQVYGNALTDAEIIKLTTL